MPVFLGGLARRLVSDKLLEEPQAIAATHSAKSQSVPFVAHIVATGLLDERSIAIAAADEFGVPMLDIAAFDLQNCQDKLIDISLIRRHRILPLTTRANSLSLATSDPGNIAVINEIKFHTGMNIEVIVAEEEKLNAAVDEFLLRQEKSYSTIASMANADLDNIEIDSTQREELDEQLNTADETPLVRFINSLLLDAFKMGASDIHFEPYEKTYRVRFRIDGVLHEITRPPIRLTGRLASRLKVMAQIDISEKRVPQDGRIRIKLPQNHTVDLRVNTLPTLWGEKIVLRVLDSHNAPLGIDMLGLEKTQKEHYLNALQNPQGLILVTGATGSGKTATLYSGLSILNTSERNISTVEDPVEINMTGINQVSINTKAGLGFASSLRAFLRQDPDIIMVGEIRDLETAEIAIRAAQTGHLVLSTLHTLNAAATISRLVSMGIPAFNLASTVSLIIAQRLARKLCSHCKESIDIPENILIEEGFSKQQLPRLQLYRAVGCDHCREGYRGRIGFYEVVPITATLSSTIMSNSDSIQIANQIKAEGILSLRESALLKVGLGLTSLDEANRLT
ncbi:MAG: type IV-A pilus assembly ATPase PilB [SAR86 cluster bacterium]|uniref:Type IV-A pilus assembly ATPase PilB n=1 Tax=SAR86 cluster bacterium TaxID=2030880 RepID=A0A2A5AYQ4_9GAMM|nr:MAG: type IV-A pilus assembly ATPase PilB [SAR86 cluster bacterium]